MAKLYATILCLIFAQSLRAELLSFQYLTSKYGISQSEVYTFLKDSRGFMWFGTVWLKSL